MADTIIGDIIGSLGDMWKNLVDEFVRAFPNVVVAIVLVVVGVFLALAAKRIVKVVLQSTKVDSWIDEQNLTPAIGGKEISSLAASLTKWYIIGLFLAQAVNQLNLAIFSEYLQLLFVKGPGNAMPVFFALLGAFVLVVAGLLVARYARNWIETSTFKMKKLLGALTEAIILIFAGIIALAMVLGKEIADTIVNLLNIFLTPFIWSFAVVLAIVVGISLLTNSREELKKISQELKKAIK
ncbi:MAG: hypothetical protein WC634_05480 [archaeon]